MYSRTISFTFYRRRVGKLICIQYMVGGLTEVKTNPFTLCKLEEIDHGMLSFSTYL